MILDMRKKLNFSATSFKTKLAFIIIFIIIIISSFIAIYFPKQFEISRIKALKEKAESITKIISVSISGPLYFSDQEALVDEVGYLNVNKDIVYIVVIDVSDSLIFAQNLPLAELNNYKSQKAHEITSGDIYNSFANIDIDNQIIGSLYIGFSLLPLRETISEMRNNILLISLLILILGAISAFIIGKFITKPLQDIVAAAGELKTGNFSVRAKITSNDEIGFLAQEFNDMVEKLNAFYQNLENMVAERTLEINNVNIKLQSEIDTRIKAEKEIKTSLKEKEVLLKEIHHRVKNNLQIITSLIYLQSRDIKDIEVLKMLQDSQNRIRSMALVHENLYQAEKFDKINFQEYTSKLCRYLSTSNGIHSSGININLDMDQIFVSLDAAINLGLIMNEIITNSFKYAFENYEPENESKTISVFLQKSDRTILVIKDNGKGFQYPGNQYKTNSLGLKLIGSLNEQLSANLRVENNNGMGFYLDITHLIIT